MFIILNVNQIIYFKLKFEALKYKLEMHIMRVWICKLDHCMKGEIFQLKDNPEVDCDIHSFSSFESHSNNYTNM